MGGKRRRAPRAEPKTGRWEKKVKDDVVLNSNVKSQLASMAKSKAKCQKDYRERLKSKDREAFLQKERERVKKSYIPAAQLSHEELQKRRTIMRERLRKWRAATKRNKDGIQEGKVDVNNPIKLEESASDSSEVRTSTVNMATDGQMLVKPLISDNDTGKGKNSSTAISKAKRKKDYRTRLKGKEREAYLQKERERWKRRYVPIANLSDEEKQRRRAITNERVRRWKAKKKGNGSKEEVRDFGNEVELERTIPDSSGSFAPINDMATDVELLFKQQTNRDAAKQVKIEVAEEVQDFGSQVEVNKNVAHNGESSVPNDDMVISREWIVGLSHSHNFAKTKENTRDAAAQKEDEIEQGGQNVVNQTRIEGTVPNSREKNSPTESIETNGKIPEKPLFSPNITKTRKNKQTNRYQEENKTLRKEVIRLKRDNIRLMQLTQQLCRRLEELESREVSILTVDENEPQETSLLPTMAPMSSGCVIVPDDKMLGGYRTDHNVES